jgi:hypothetical protein
MKSLIFLLLISTASGIFITCRFHNDYDWSVIGYVYTCQVISIDLSDNSTFITKVNGTHLRGKSNFDVKMIIFGFENNFCAQSNLTSIPKGFLNFFPNFIGFYFHRCPINFLNGYELEEYPKLEWYKHLQSNLTRVPGNFFASTQNMKFVDFWLNKIQHVGEGLLDNLESLQEVYFDSEVCINKYALTPSKIPALIEVLRQNCTDIEPETTTQLTTTNQPSKCEIEDLEDFVCGLDEDVESLREKVQTLEPLKGQVEDFIAKNKILEENVENLSEENQKMKELLEAHAHALVQLELKVLELTSRPCGCLA